MLVESVLGEPAVNAAHVRIIPIAGRRTPPVNTVSDRVETSVVPATARWKGRKTGPVVGSQVVAGGLRHGVMLPVGCCRHRFGNLVSG